MIKIKKTIVFGLMLMLLLTGFAVLPHGAVAETVKTKATDDSIHIYAPTFVDPLNSNHKFITVQMGELNISLRPALYSSDHQYGELWDSWSVVEKTSNSIEIEYNDGGNISTITLNFAKEKDAVGDDFLYITGSATTVNETNYNLTYFLLYVGSNSIFDTTFIENDYNKIYSSEIWQWGLFDSRSPERVIKLNNSNAWMIEEVDATDYYIARKAYNLYISYSTTNPYVPFAPILMNHGHLHVAVKIKHPNKAQQTGPKILMLNPFTNLTKWYKVYDNESIYKKAAEMGFTTVIAWDWEYKFGTDAPSYEFYNDTIKNAIMDIASYTHKYGMKFGLYFGWLDFAKTSYSPIATNYNFTDSVKQAVLSAWENYSSQYSNFVDVYAWDYGGAIWSPSINTLRSAEWSWWSFWTLNSIWRNLTDGKEIIYNAGMYGSGWFLGGRFIPMKFEAITISDLQTYNFNLIDPWVHSLGYEMVSMNKRRFYDQNSGFKFYNETAAKIHTEFCYENGIMPTFYYAIWNSKGLESDAKYFKDWKSGMYVYHDIKGTAGTDNVQLENDHEIRLLLTNTTSQITVTPHVAKLPVQIYTNKTVKIEYEINPTPNIVVKDLTTGKTVPWQKGSVIFDAQAGHTYEIYDVVQEATSETISLISPMIGLVVFVMVINMVVLVFKKAKRMW